MIKTQIQNELIEEMQKLIDTIISVKYANETYRQDAIKILREIIKELNLNEDAKINVESLK